MRMHTWITAIPLALAPFAGAQHLTPLFESVPIEAWTRVGGADFQLDEGVLIGHGAPTRNSFLVSPDTLADFILETDVWISDGGNSGIQIRSHVADDAVVGYQIEIDPSPRAWSGGLYDERRRGWLDPLEGRDEARNAFRPGQWNHFRIECVGPRIRSWVNNVPCADYLDAMDVEGHLAFQVHAGPGMTVKWREPRFVAIGRHVWQPIFDGQTLNAWQPDDADAWSVREGAIVGRVANARASLVSRELHRDFTLRLRFRAREGEARVGFNANDRSGSPSPTDVIIGAAPDSLTGCLADAVRSGRIDPASFQPAAKPGEWNDLTICSLDGRISVHVNGRRIDDVRGTPASSSRPISLVVLPGSHVEFKDIAFLVPEPD